MISSKEILRAMNRDMFVASTGAAGVAPGTALSTTPPLILWNPPGNLNAPPDSQPLVAVLLASRLAYVSGTLGAGVIVYGILDQATAPTGGTGLTPQQLSAVPAGSGLAPLCKAYQGATLSGTPTLLMPAFTVASSPSGLGLLKDPLEGEIVLGPGKALVLQEIGAAGTSPLVQLAFEWLEVTGSFGQRRVE